MIPIDTGTIFIHGEVYQSVAEARYTLLQRYRAAREPAFPNKDERAGIFEALADIGAFNRMFPASAIEAWEADSNALAA